MTKYESTIQAVINEKLNGVERSDMFKMHINIDDVLLFESMLPGYARKVIRRDLFPCFTITRMFNKRVWSDKNNRQPMDESQRRDSERRTGNKSEASKIDDLLNYIRTAEKGW